MISNASRLCSTYYIEQWSCELLLLGWCLRLEAFWEATSKRTPVVGSRYKMTKVTAWLQHVTT